MSGRRRIRGRPTAALAIALALGAPAGAQGLVEDPAYDACAAEHAAAAQRRQCIADWRHAAVRLLEYGREHGYYDDEGVVTSKFLADSLDWRAMLGLPPAAHFPRCMSRQAWVRVADPRVIWDCVKRADPDAARRDQI